MARHFLISFLVVALMTIACSKSILRAEEESMFQEAELSESDNGDALYESADELLIGSDVKMSSDDNAWAGRR